MGNVNVVIGDQCLGNAVYGMSDSYDYDNGKVTDLPEVYSWELPGSGGFALIPGQTYRIDLHVASVTGTVFFSVSDMATSTTLASTTITAAGVNSLSFTVPSGGAVGVSVQSNVGTYITIGNVLLHNGSTYGDADYYRASIRMAQDYYPFGMEMPGRGYTPDYRYGYQGSEKDNELTGSDSHYSTYYKELDARLCR